MRLIQLKTRVVSEDVIQTFKNIFSHLKKICEAEMTYMLSTPLFSEDFGSQFQDTITFLQPEDVYLHFWLAPLGSLAASWPIRRTALVNKLNPPC